MSFKCVGSFPQELEILGDYVIMLFGAGTCKTSVHLQSIGVRITQMTANGETVANNKAEKFLGDINPSGDQLQK